MKPKKITTTHTTQRLELAVNKITPDIDHDDRTDVVKYENGEYTLITQFTIKRKLRPLLKYPDVRLNDIDIKDGVVYAEYSEDN